MSNNNEILWQGNKLREALNKSNFTVTDFASKLSVSRQAANDWMNGTVPKGIHLIKLCKLLNININSLFLDEDNFVTMPKNRLNRNVQQNAKRDEKSLDFCKSFAYLFSNNKNPIETKQIDFRERTSEMAMEIAAMLRSSIEIREDDPILYKHLFQLLDSLGIFVIIAEFPIKSSAMYAQIHTHHVIFINIDNKINDTIFYTLHEIAHCLCEMNRYANISGINEEEFCDLVASYSQLPDKYIEKEYHNIKNEKNVGMIINYLKIQARINTHALHGFWKRLKKSHPNFGSEISVHGADANLRKEFDSLNNLFERCEVLKQHVELFNLFSRRLLILIKNKYNSKEISIRAIQNLLLLKDYVDAESVAKEYFEENSR